MPKVWKKKRTMLFGKPANPKTVGAYNFLLGHIGGLVREGRPIPTVNTLANSIPKDRKVCLQTTSLLAKGIMKQFPNARPEPRKWAGKSAAVAERHKKAKDIMLEFLRKLNAKKQKVTSISWAYANRPRGIVCSYPTFAKFLEGLYREHPALAQQVTTEKYAGVTKDRQKVLARKRSLEGKDIAKEWARIQQEKETAARQHDLGKLRELNLKAQALLEIDGSIEQKAAPLPAGKAHFAELALQLEYGKRPVQELQRMLSENEAKRRRAIDDESVSDADLVAMEQQARAIRAVLAKRTRQRSTGQI